MGIESQHGDGKSPSELELLLGEAAAGLETFPPVHRTTSIRGPMSFAQRQIWFFEQWKPGTATYHTPTAFWLDGSHDPHLLRKALNLVVSRHEALRTRFSDQHGNLEQIIDPDVSIPFKIADVSGLPPKERGKAALDLAREEAILPFDLRRGPLIRALVVPVETERSLVLLTAHHAVIDGHSVSVILTELDEISRALSKHGNFDLRASAIRGIDFAQYEHNRVERGELQAQIDFWRQQLAGAPEVLQVPTSRPRPKVQTFNGRTRIFDIDESLAAEISRLSSRSGNTSFVAYLTAFNVLIARLSGMADSGTCDVVVGTPVATRALPELNDLVGLLINTVPLRTIFPSHVHFDELLEKVGGVVADAYANHDVPLEEIVKALNVQRSLTHNPIIQAVFGGQAPAAAGRSLDGAAMSDVYIERGTAKFDLTWSMFDMTTPRFEVEYNTDLFDDALIGQMIECYVQLLRSAVDDPHAPIGELDLLSQAKRQEIIRRSGAAPGQLTDVHCVHEQFADHARRAPDAIAVTDGERAISYGELDRRSVRLARFLQRAGAAPGTVVGLCFERGAELVVAILAVLKTGAAYLPLDPGYPSDRLRYMLSDAGAHLAITGENTRDRLPPGPWQVVDLDMDEELFDAEPAHHFAGSADPNDTAYVLYTSGTSGRPKAVEVTHRNVARLLTATQGWFGFDHRDTWTMFHSYAFDFSVWEMWGALAYGGRLVVVPYLVSRSPEAFHQLVHDEGVTVLNQTPSAFRQFERIDAETPQTELALRLIIFGGESLDLNSVRKWYGRHGSRTPRLVNMYGITETTVHVTYRELSESDLTHRSPIGKALPDLAVYVCDSWGNLLPESVPGELYIGGAGVARGYLGRPALTSERFVPDPFSGQPGARLFRTGDLGRYTADGELEYLGRNDSQVKIRGFRIEIGEIEAALTRHPEVEEAVVVVRSDGDGAAHLISYTAPSSTLSAGALRAYVSEFLPSHMIPATFIFLESLPMNANGKVNYGSLPAPEKVRPALATSYVAPRTELEGQLAECWLKVLDVDKVGINDNFFELGGDSIRSLQMLGKAKESGLSIGLQDLFRSPTIARLAELAKPSLNGNEESGGPTEPFSLIAPEDREQLPDGLEDAYPMSVLQAAMVYHMTLDTEMLPYHNVNEFRVNAPFDLDVFRRATADVVARHMILRTGFEIGAYSEPMQLVYPHAELPIEVEDLRGLTDEEQDRRLIEVLDHERRSPFDITQPPLLRYLLHRRSDDTFQWTITEHHAVFDGWSLFSHQAETMRRYMQLLSDPSAPPEPRPASEFRDFIALERRAIDSASDKAYWQEKLARFAPVMLPRWPELPVASDEYDTPTEGEIRDGLRRWRFTSRPNAAHRTTETLIPADLCTELIETAAEVGVPLKSVLLSAYMKVLSLVTGKKHVVAGVSNHGRTEDIDSTEVRGMFLNIPPIIVDVSEGSWRELIQRTFATEHELLPHRRYPYAHMQWYVSNRSKLFDTTFLYNHFHVMSDVLDSGVEIVDGRVDNQAEYRAEPNSFSVNAGVLRNPRTSKMVWRMDYYTDKVSDGLAELMLSSYLKVLRAMTRPDDRHEMFSPLGEDERRRLLADWSGEANASTVGSGVHEVIARQAQANPDALAVSDGVQQISYGDLEHATNRLARYLKRLGVGRDSVVGLHLSGDARTVEAFLGILKTGAACLPLGRAMSVAAMRQILEQTGARAVVSTKDFALDAGNVIVLDRDAGDIAVESADALRYDSRQEDPAIVAPDSADGLVGVQVTHGALSAYVSWATQALMEQRTGDSAILASASGEGFLRDVLTALSAGERTNLIDDPAHGEDLTGRLERLGAFTFLSVTPRQLDWLSRALSEESARRLAGALLVRGQRFPSRIMAAWRRRVPEGTVIYDHGVGGGFAFDAADGTRRSRVPIGNPIPGVTAYVLDHDLNLVPPGVMGELFLGGEHVPRGLAGRPAKTAQWFLPDPFSRLPGRRLRRTGHLARRLPGGELELVGSGGHETIIDGHHIDLDEAEAIIAEHPAISDVLVTEDPEVSNGDRSLVGFFVTDRPVTAEELADFLRDRYWAAFALAALRPVDKIPLDRSGEVSIATLIALTNGTSDSAEAAAPQTGAPSYATATEREIAELWTDLLEIPQPEVTADFFELGGHSLKAAQLRDRINQRFRINLPLTVVFRARNIRSLAQRVADLQAADSREA